MLKNLFLVPEIPEGTDVGDHERDAELILRADWPRLMRRIRRRNRSSRRCNWPGRSRFAASYW